MRIAAVGPDFRFPKPYSVPALLARQAMVMRLRARAEVELLVPLHRDALLSSKSAAGE
jgi:hypothetical protein